MAVAQQSKPKWVDPDSMWDDDVPASEGDNVIEMTRPESDIDRFHNHEDLSPEAMARAISDLQASADAGKLDVEEVRVHTGEDTIAEGRVRYGSGFAQEPGD